MVVLRGNDVTLRWTITKCLDGSEVPEDFSDADLSVFVISIFGRMRANALVEENVITISIPGSNQRAGKIGIEAVWSKNSGKNWSRAKHVDVLTITENPILITNCSGATVDNHVVEIQSKLVGSVGYDGLTPEIINGTWWLGSVDTGVLATGDRGAPFTFEDFTDEQLEYLRKPATDAAEQVAKVEGVVRENEEGRNLSESERVSAEDSRRNSETVRSGNEKNRVIADEQRGNAEQARADSEQLRVSGEENRDIAERARVDAENSRTSAEQERDKAAAKIEPAVKEATDAAKEAVEQGGYAKRQGDLAKIAAAEAVAGKMALFIDMWNNACGTYGKYNTATGFFELNGLTDITYSEAIDINNLGVPIFSAYACILKRGRTNYPFVFDRVSTSIATPVSISCLCASWLNKIVILRLPQNIAVTSAYYAFQNCGNLKSILGEITVQQADVSGMFAGCSNLEDISLIRLNSSISFAQSPLLSTKSIRIMVENKYSTTATTITLHPTAYATAIADQEIVAKALEKNITIASA